MLLRLALTRHRDLALNAPTLSQQIATQAERLGFAACGIAKADFLPEAAQRIEQWLAESCQGEMRYLQRNKEKRYDPRLLVEGTQSIVSVLYNYYPAKALNSHGNYKIAKYAYGKDYHIVLKDKLMQLLNFIESLTGKLEGTRAFVDSAPVVDRAWAERCGLGFIGKNTALIHPKKGSFFFIGHLFLPIALPSIGMPVSNRCGRCTKCLDACPTHALDKPFHIDARKCISYLTIEYKGSLEGQDPSLFNDWIFGCDICQDVCPYNRFSVANAEPLFQPSEQLMSMRKADWQQLDEARFKAIFQHTALERAGCEGLKRNVEFVASGTQPKED